MELLIDGYNVLAVKFLHKVLWRLIFLPFVLVVVIWLSVLGCLEWVIWENGKKTAKED